MRLHAGVGPRADTAPCRVLVGGYGFPGCRDLGFGERFVRLAEGLEWPDAVVVEDLPCSAHLVLHRLQELRPAKMILVGATARGVDPPGTVRRYRADVPAASPAEVHAALAETIGGRVALDRMLSVLRHFGGLPPETVIVEVEAADSSVGLGFSEEMAAAIDPLLDAVRHEVADPGGSQLTEPAMTRALPGKVAGVNPTSTSPGRGPEGAVADTALPGIDQLFQYAQAHAQVRALEALADHLPAHAGLTMAARFVPAGNGLGMRGDFYDVLALPGGAVGIVIADVAGAPRVQAAAVSAQVRMAVQALALVEGDNPARLLEHLRALVSRTGVGRGSTVAYLVMDPADGSLRVASAGHFPPLVIGPAGEASFVDVDGGPALGVGADDGTARAETVVRLERGSTAIVYTDGLLGGGLRGEGLRALHAAAEAAPRSLEALCDHVLRSCVAGAGAEGNDEVSVVAVRILG